MKKILIVVLLVVLVAVSGLGYYFWQKSQQVFCPGCKPYADLIQVENPKPGQTIQNHFIVTGQARGYWYFEASFPIKLVDLSGNIISQEIAQAQGDWMTENFVPFEATLNFDIATTTQPAILVLHNDNPSGLPENDKEIRIPVVLTK